MVTLRPAARIVGLIFCCVSACFAQLKEGDRPIWSQGRLYFASSAGVVEQQGLQNPSHRRLKAPPGSIWTGVWEGQAWALGAPRLEREVPQNATAEEKLLFPRIRQRIWVSSDFAIWDAWGDITIPRSDEGPNKVIGLHPISQDRVVSRWQVGVWVDGRIESTCILKRSQGGACDMESLVFADLGEGIFIPAASDAKDVKQGVQAIERSGKRYVYNLKRRLLTIESIPMDIGSFKGGLPVIEFDDGFAIVNRHYGMFWVFDEQGRFRRRIRLFDQGVDSELCQLKAYWRHERAVLGCQPTRDGKLLVATRSAGAVLFARTDHPLLDEQGQPEKPELFQARQRWSWSDRPDILWWEVDPKEATASKINAPHGAPTVMTEQTATSGISWTYNLHGDPLFSPPEREPDVESQGGEQPAKPARPAQPAKKPPKG